MFILFNNSVSGEKYPFIMGFPRQTFLFAGDTGPVDALNKVPLQNEVHYQQRQYAQQRACHVDGFVQVGCGIGCGLLIAGEVAGEVVKLYHQGRPVGLGI